jgi:hypothetical protein
MPASRALSTGSLNALLSTTASARPSAFDVTAVLVAFTISATIESLDPVHWNSAPSSLQASSAPYCVGVKNGFVVTWQTKTNLYFGVLGKLPNVPPDAAAAEPPSSSPVHAASSADAAREALTRPVPASSRRRVGPGRSRVSTACSTTGSTLRMETPHFGSARGSEVRQCSTPNW